MCRLIVHRARAIPGSTFGEAVEVVVELVAEVDAAVVETRTWPMEADGFALADAVKNGPVFDDVAGCDKRRETEASLWEEPKSFLEPVSTLCAVVTCSDHDIGSHEIATSI